jgi:hypothetical protein
LEILKKSSRSFLSQDKKDPTADITGLPDIFPGKDFTTTAVENR